MAKKMPPHETPEQKLRILADYLIANPQFGTSPVLQKFVEFAADLCVATNNVANFQVVRVIASCGDGLGETLLVLMVAELEARKARAEIHAKKPIIDILRRNVAEQRKNVENHRAFIFSLLDTEDPEVIRAKRLQARRDQENLQADRADFSKTFSKSNSRLIVQGGAPGSRR